MEKQSEGKEGKVGGERERLCWERGGGGEGGRLQVGRKEGNKEMHKQMLALGIDAISSVSQLMTNSTEKREEQKESSNSVSKSKRGKTEGLCEGD